ncbi:MAG: hypothetical protein EOO04_30805 [Chitinophagaceae bacterium]|nr:MAG: hypothetical protein EOO04_30805 [Chitinophagaceae bacterium]
MECNSTKFNSVFSFRPLINTWKELAQNGREGSRQLYRELLDKVSQVPELMLPIVDENVIENNRNLIEQMMATIFPVTLSDKEDIYGTLIPFKMKVIYGSERFRKLFLGSADNRIIMPDIHNPNSLEKEKLIGAYQLILSRLYNVPIPDIMTTVHSYSCPDTTLDRYMELEIDTRFVNVTYKGDLPPLSADCLNGWMNGYEIPDIPGIQQAFNLENFEFEGMVIFNLVSVPGAQTAIKPFYRVNDHLVISELYSNSTVPHEVLPSPEKVNDLYNVVVEAFKDSQGPRLIPYIDEALIKKYPFMDAVIRMGYKSAIMCPLFTSSKVMIGMVMVMSEKENQFTWKHVAKLEPAIPLFKLALEKTQQDLDHQVDRVIKDQFTAVQDAVEWRFTETALNYLISKHRGEQTKIDPITFNHVYPLYGAIDIRNSSVERNLAIQQDMLEQLRLAQNIIKLAKQQTSFPLLDEILFKLKKYIHAVNNILFADEEIAIHHFLKNEIVNMFTHIQSIIPSLDSEIKVYLSAIDSPVEMLYNHRKSYEESITTINNEVARFIDEEQKAAQKIFPHYFERFVTDGVDFNIYIGQSITPEKKFDFFYLKNLKIWQLNTLAKAAILTNKLQKKLKVPLQTSQLILAHSQPISISFRTAERKFDVDGAYNIRYEIIKKRIDKVHIKDTNERLTQPGMLAIVYSQTHEANEYLEYIDFLQSQGLLTGEVEKFDLEDLQGVSGMRGLRVGINFNDDLAENQQSRTASSISN